MGKQKKSKAVWSERRKWLMTTLSSLGVLAVSKLWDSFWLPVAAPPASRVGSLPTATNSVVATQSSSAATVNISNHVVATASLSLGERLGKQVIRKPTP